MTAVVLPVSAPEQYNPNRSILISIVLSVALTLILWLIQSIFNLNGFWVFLVYIALLFFIFYWLLPRIRL